MTVRRRDTEMSETGGRPASTSSVQSLSLLEIKAETQFVLKAFLRQTLSISSPERPGRVGGAYKDHNKYSSTVKLAPKARDGFNSQDEDHSSADEKKRSLKDIIKRLPRRSTLRRDTQDHKPYKDHNSMSDGPQKGASPGLSHLRDQLEDIVISPSSTSEEEDGERKQQKKLKKKKKFQKQISDFFRRRLEKEKEKEKEKSQSRPQRPSCLPVSNGPDHGPTLGSPNHSLAFYEEVAERLDKIAHKSRSIKKPHTLSPPSPVQPSSSPVAAPTPIKPLPACDKDAVVRQLINILSMEGDAINTKINSDPFLRSQLTRLSYPSFAKLLDTFSNCEAQEAQPPAPVPASPTLRRLAVTMEVSRRVVTATGTQRMQGYAERYMETFAPWVKSQGGWENIILEEVSEYD